MPDPNVTAGPVEQLAEILELPEIHRLIRDLELLQWTGRPGYSKRALVGMVLAKSLFACPTWSRFARQAREHAGLCELLGGEVPSVHACRRIAKKLRDHNELLQSCINQVLSSLRGEGIIKGRDIALDGSDLPAYSNGQRTLWNGGPKRRHFSDPDAAVGHRSSTSTHGGGLFFGHKLHAAVCVESGLPVAWKVAPGNESEQTFVERLLEQAQTRGFGPAHSIADSAYDVAPVYEACEQRNCRPIIQLKKTGRVKRGEHKPPRCEHGEWEFAGTDYSRKAAKYRCPAHICTPAAVWIKASRLHTLIPRETKRWRDLFARRTAIERTFGHLKNEWALLPLRVRGIERVQLHADLTILAKLSCALARARAAPLAA